MRRRERTTVGTGQAEIGDPGAFVKVESTANGLMGMTSVSFAATAGLWGGSISERQWVNYSALTTVIAWSPVVWMDRACAPLERAYKGTVLFVWGEPTPKRDGRV